MRPMTMRPCSRTTFWVGAVCWLLAVSVPAADPVAEPVAGLRASLELEGFTEPFRSIEVPSDETGIIDELFVREGQRVTAGQKLLRLNSDVYEALLAIAEQNVRAEGRIDAARAELRMKQQRIGKLESLRADGHARQEEVDRAAAELAVAEANLRSAQEDLIARRLEYDKIKTQIARRTILAPVDGVITTFHKELGEFVAPNNPDILTLVQIDTLLANFTLMAPQAQHIEPGQTMLVDFFTGPPVAGVVEFVSPVTDARSGTVLVKIRIDNAAGQFRSGQRCKIQIPN